MEKTLLVVAGPTAVGKTTCGIDLAGFFGSEIISADSRQIYRELRIGTAVPSEEELSKVPHHFIRSIPVETAYHASRYEQEVLGKLDELYKERDLVLLVGGSGLYIDAVCSGIDALPSADPVIRERLRRRFEEEGLGPLVDELAVRDPVSHSRIDLRNHMRVLKALEISIQTGRPYSEHLTHRPKERSFRILRIALDMDRRLLYQRINERVDRMMRDGLLEEVRRLAPLRHYTAMKTVGYRELFDHLDGKCSLDEAVDLIKRNTRRFARKQLTWFRKDPSYTWFEPGSPEEIRSWTEKWLEGKDR